MNIGRKRRKRQWVRGHRMSFYCHTLDRVINGQAKPADATLRWKKYKEVE